MTLIVHGRATSSNVQAVMWGLTEMGLTAERRDVGGRFGGTDTATYRVMNPFGLVPVLEDGDVVMFESAAILRYLLTQYGPDGMVVAPQADMWAEWAKNKLCRAYILDVFWAYYRTPEDQRDMSAVTQAQAAFEDGLGLVLNVCRPKGWIGADRLTLADIWVGHVLYRYFTLDLPRNPPEGAEDYYAALTSRAAYRDHVMVDYSELRARALA